MHIEKNEEMAKNENAPLVSYSETLLPPPPKKKKKNVWTRDVIFGVKKGEIRVKKGDFRGDFGCL